MQRPEGEDAARSKNGAGCLYSRQGENKGLKVGLKRQGRCTGLLGPVDMFYLKDNGKPARDLKQRNVMIAYALFKGPSGI